MNKTDIKTKWGQYMDTDNLVEEMMRLLTKYNHRNTEHGVCCILEKFFTAKEPLIKLLQKSDNYVGDLRIVLDEQLERRGNESEIHKWIDVFPNKVKAVDCIKKKTDANGKVMTDYFRIGKQTISIADLENEELKTSLATRHEALSAFTSEGYTTASETEYKRFIEAIGNFRFHTSPTMSAEDIEPLASYKIHEGMKTSRAFNKICHHFAVDKSTATITTSRGEKKRVYDIEFAKYADMVSDKKRNIKFFISVNPLDYLTMSFGINWGSCHTIDKHNQRGIAGDHYGGGYCGGTMSYMCDETSIITYVHNTMPENYEAGKVYRNMFHLGGDGVLLQNRIYPQGNDGCTDLYKEFRIIMQREMAKLLGLEANKWIRRGAITNVASVGCHYKDYNSRADCNISYPSERPQCQSQVITIGSTRLCPNCGTSADGMSAGNLSHYNCAPYEPTDDDDDDEFFI